MNYKYTQLKIYIFCFVLTSAFIWMLTHYSTGYFSIDDSEYHFMVKAFCDNGKFSLDNGYEQFPSKELTLNLPFDQPMIENNGKLFPKITPL